eukprot:s564_g3.t12
MLRRLSVGATCRCNESPLQSMAAADSFCRPGTNGHPMIMFCHELTTAEFTGSSSSGRTTANLLNGCGMCAAVLPVFLPREIVQTRGSIEHRSRCNLVRGPAVLILLHHSAIRGLASWPFRP